jgi:hypothetical protein
MTDCVVTSYDSYTGVVSEIRLRLHPLDVGWDLRAEAVVVELPAQPRSLVSAADARGQRVVVEGQTHAVAAWLRRAGYVVIVA